MHGKTNFTPSNKRRYDTGSVLHKSLYEAREITYFCSAESFHQHQRKSQLSEEDFGWILNTGDFMQLEQDGVLNPISKGSLYSIHRGSKKILRIRGARPSTQFMMCIFQGEMSRLYFEHISEQLGKSMPLVGLGSSQPEVLRFAKSEKPLSELGKLECSLMIFDWFTELDKEIDEERERLKQFISKQPEELIKLHSIVPSLKVLARKLRINGNMLKKELRKLWRIEPREGLRLIKLYHAATLLAGGENSIQTVRISAGYLSPGTFPVAFRKEFDCSPSELRDRASEQDLADRLCERLQALRKNNPRESPATSEILLKNLSEPSAHAMMMFGQSIERPANSGKSKGKMGAELYATGCTWYLFIEGTRFFDTPSQSIEVPPGTIVSFKSAIHARWRTEGDKPEKFILLYSFHDKVNKIQEAITDAFGNFAQIPLDHRFIQQTGEFLKKRYEIDIDKKDPRDLFEVSRLTYRWLCQWASAMAEHGLSSSEAHDLSNTPIGVPEAQRLRSIHSVAAYAKELGYSVTHAGRIMKRNVNMAPRNFLRLARIGTSCNYLRKTDLSVEEIAKLCGYGDSTSFGRAFKSIMSSTPKQYRAASRG